MIPTGRHLCRAEAHAAGGDQCRRPKLSLHPGSLHPWIRLGLLQLLWVPVVMPATTEALRDRALAALRRAARFYAEQAAIHGGYHYAYTADLSWGRSEHGVGKTQVEVQPMGTPGVGLAFLEAWQTTREPFLLEAARRAARALVQGQLCSGGWHYLIEFDPAKRKRYAYRADHNCASGAFNTTTLDDNTTQGALRLLMRVDRELGFQDSLIHEAAIYGLDSLVKAQYANGAWPQRYSRFPDPKAHQPKPASYPDDWPRQWPDPDYAPYYTFNDNVIVDAIDTLLEAARIYREPRYLEAARRGGDFILLAQMPDPQPAWAQQYDFDMHPAWARRFEPPAITAGESQGILRMLLILYAELGDPKYLQPIPRALDYFRRSALPPPQRPSHAWLQAAAGGGPVLARFYELRTNRPLFFTKGTQVIVRGYATYRPDGYTLTYSPDNIITHYVLLLNGRWLDRLEQEFRRAASTERSKLKRPDQLYGIAPWSEAREPSPTPAEIEQIIAAMDERGAWVEPGYIGAGEPLVSVFAARPMLVRLGNQWLELSEDQTLEVFTTTQRPLDKVIRSRTFIRNVRLLSRFLRESVVNARPTNGSQ